MIENEEVNRMRWAARRGMLELDLLLEPFVTSRYSQLSATEQQSFVKLMRCEDQDLFAWFIQREKPQDPELAAIVSQILHFARSAPQSR
jgi:antitoxin CptB